MEKERSDVKKIFWVFLGISLVLGIVIYVLYKNNENDNEEVVDIFKEKEEEGNDNDDSKNEGEMSEISKVVVDIKGMVVNPGVYEVDSTARVNDVIELAGGLLENADTSLINLAKIVSDEMAIIIYSDEEAREKYKEELCVCNSELMKNDACVNNNDNNSDDGLVDINTCTIDELMEVRGIGRVKAEAIIKYREDNGNFSSIEDIQKVSGIGESLFEKIKEYIKV